ncbi:helix-turn-helix domain-containing protein [Paraburkholderia terrae]|uniref:helix-turn-helix domain-containing protein n=1 Tax=Paraburkholderia terrae TaxID=311230 RepID=UPI00296B35EA|nr:XRE family transcriptional regulator [Paraburkholderia terrae]MDW3662534.1 XRE family transcriptional regulator [Paraburkholderia terrae]
MDINALIARRVRELRDSHGLSLEALAERSGVSRSAISLIERAQSSPTAAVLDKLATALGVVLASLFEAPATPAEAPSPLARAAEQAVWTDPGSGYVRRNLSPALPSPIQLVEVHFPAGQRVAYETGARDAEIHQQIWLIEGAMEISAGDTHWRLEAGDCVAMRLDCPTVFHNPARNPARYLVALSALPFSSVRRNT